MRYFEKKHYEVIARCIAAQRNAIENERYAHEPLYTKADTDQATHIAHANLWQVADRLAKAFALDNSQFNRKRFMQACGVEQ